jgi:hypothetical protein
MDALVYPGQFHDLKCLLFYFTSVQFCFVTFGNHWGPILENNGMLLSIEKKANL